MSVRSVPESTQKIMDCLAVFKFLTVPQMVTLGLAKHKENAYKFLARGEQGHHPLIKRIEFGFYPKLGRLPNIYYLTKTGAMHVSEWLDCPLSDLRYPIGNQTLFHRDYFHRTYTIDFHILLWLQAQQGHIELQFFDTYFDQMGSNRNPQKGGASQKFTKVFLDDERFLIPDAIFLMKQGDKEKFFALEVHNGEDSKRAAKDLGKHIEAIQKGVIPDKYGRTSANKVLMVFQSTNCAKYTLNRIRQMQVFQDFSPFFVFNTLERFKISPLHSWLDMNGQKVGL